MITVGACPCEADEARSGLLESCNRAVTVRPDVSTGGHDWSVWGALKSSSHGFAVAYLAKDRKVIGREGRREDSFRNNQVRAAVVLQLDNCVACF